MLDLSAFAADGFWAFLQVLARVSAVIVTAPALGSREVPATVKTGLAGVLSFALLPLVKPTLAPNLPPTLYGMVAILLGQTLVGLLMGLVVSLLLTAVRVGGDIVDYQMGFTQAATFNPQFNETVSPIASLQYRYALVLYLLGNGHWMLLAALVRSFTLLPVEQLSLSGLTTAAWTDMTFAVLVMGLQIAAPGAAVLLVTDVAFAFLNRAVPQMQVFWVGMPVKVMAGLAVVMAALPVLTYTIGQMASSQSVETLTVLLRSLHK